MPELNEDGQKAARKEENGIIVDGLRGFRPLVRWKDTVKQEVNGYGLRTGTEVMEIRQYATAEVGRVAKSD